jgi:hypothetical protein
MRSIFAEVLTLRGLDNFGRNPIESQLQAMPPSFSPQGVQENFAIALSYNRGTSAFG